MAAATSIASLSNVKATKNGDQGVTYDERGSGNLVASIDDSTVTGNDKESQGIDCAGSSPTQATAP